MLDRIADMTAAIAGLLGTKARVVARDLEQAGALMGAYIVAGCCGVIGLIAILGALIVALAESLGTAGALALAGAAATALGVGIVVAARWRAMRADRPTREELEREAEEQLARLTGGAATGSPAASIASTVVDSITGNPSTAAGAAFAALAILGPRRVIRVLADTTAAASLATSVSRLITELGADASRASGTASAPPTRATHDQVAPAGPDATAPLSA